MSAKTILEFVNAVGLEFCAYSVSKKKCAFDGGLCGLPLMWAFDCKFTITSCNAGCDSCVNNPFVGVRPAIPIPTPPPPHQVVGDHQFLNLKWREI